MSLDSLNIVICPGFHAAELTAQFIAGLRTIASDHCLRYVVFPIDRYPPYSTCHLLEFLYQQPQVFQQPLVFIAFSAGVVAAIGAANVLQLGEKSIHSLIAIDGWGVPLMGFFPVYRLSHDYWTHWSSALLGAGQESFYADPSVDHLQMWRSPQTVRGWQVRSAASKFQCNLRDQTAQDFPTTAAEFILTLLTR